MDNRSTMYNDSQVPNIAICKHKLDHEEYWILVIGIISAIIATLAGLCRGRALARVPGARAPPPSPRAEGGV